METNNKRFRSSSKEKKLKRKEVLEKKKAIDEIIKAASAVKDHLAAFPPFCHYDRNGLSVYLETGFGEQLSSPMKKYIQNLLKANMEGPYGSEWPIEEKVKRREMVAPEARYMFVRESPNSSADENPVKTMTKGTVLNGWNRMGAVMLTVQKANVSAMNFYTSKVRYTISTISPSRVDPLIGAEKSYEILCKTFDNEAKAKLEENINTRDQ